jgi:hypothetical protein
VRTIIAIAVMGIVLLTLATAAAAQQFPNVSGLTPFSSEANFMSLPGYLRWLVFQQTGQWITYAEAARIVREQTGQ